MPLRIGIRLAADILMDVFHGNALDLVFHHLVTAPLQSLGRSTWTLMNTPVMSRQGKNEMP